MGGCGEINSDPLKSIVISWQPPEENVDGSAIEDLLGYQVFYGPKPGYYVYDFLVVLQTQAEIIIPPGWGEIHLAVKAYDTSGNESDFSEELLINLY